MEEGEYVEITHKPWRSTYAHQKRPDVTGRTAKLIPRDRLVTKKGRYFTTNTSQQQLVAEIDEQEDKIAEQAGYAIQPEKKEVESAPKQKKQFTPKGSTTRR